MVIGAQSPPWEPLATALLTLLVAAGVVSYAASKGAARSTSFAAGDAAVVEVCAGRDDRAELSFTYVPQASTRTGEVGFGVPLAGPLQSRVVSYRTL